MHPRPPPPIHMQVRKTAFGSIDAVPHRHFEDPADAVASLKAAGAFVCALETTDGASSLFDVRFPLPPLLGPEKADESTLKPSNEWAKGGERGGGSRVEGGGGGVTADLEGMGVVALVLGNEVTGVDERVLGLCDLVVEVRDGTFEKGRGKENPHCAHQSHANPS